MSFPTVQTLLGDCRATLPTLPERSVQCIVTSPPYFGLRSYLPADHADKPLEIGQETTPADFIRTMVEVFTHLHRVLKDDGTLWLNLGDSYANDAKWGGSTGGKHVTALHGDSSIGRQKKTPGLKPKDLIGIPWRVALALQDAGWYLRQDIIWHKPNPMPESVTDRCTKAHEYLFLLTKSEKYYFNQKAILEPVSPNTHARLSQNVQDQIGSARANGGDGAKSNGNMKAVGRKFDPAPGNKNNPSFDAAMAVMPEERNKRSVWTIATAPYSAAHFATFPPDLIRPCILAGSRPGDTVLDPFGGSGTVGQVALELARSALLCELNPDYIPLIQQRTHVTPGLPGFAV